MITQGLPVELHGQQEGTVLLVLVHEAAHSLVEDLATLIRPHKGGAFSLFVAVIESEDESLRFAKALRGSLGAKHHAVQSFASIEAAKLAGKRFARDLRGWTAQWYHIGSFGKQLTGYDHPQEDLACVLPFYNGDAIKAVELMEYIGKLGPVDGPLILTTEESTDDAYVDSIREQARDIWEDVEVFRFPSCETPLKWPMSNTYVWRHTARHMASMGLPWLWMETDGIPCQKDWHRKLCDLYRLSGMPFLGHITQYGNLNGLACYPADVAAWSERAFNADLAWDLAMTEEVQHATQKANRAFNHVWLLDEDGNPTTSGGNLPRFTCQEDVDRLVSPDCLIWHRDKDLTLVPFMEERLALN